MVCFAHAKINWSLAVSGRREDGYHLLDTLMQTISVFDTLSFAPAEALTLETEGDIKVPGADNLVLRAARLLREALGVQKGAAIRLTKRIPAGAGLGGGSADAAAALHGLNALWALGLSTEALARLGARLGADIPFCLTGGFARVQGIGERVLPLPDTEPYHLALIWPGQALSTPAVFSAYDRQEDRGGSSSVCGAHVKLSRGQEILRERPALDRLQTALLAHDLPAVQGNAGNALQPVAVRILPEIQACLAALVRAGARASVMTGSGSAVFGLFDTQAAAQGAAAACREKWPFACAAHTVSRSAARKA